MEKNIGKDKEHAETRNTILEFIFAKFYTFGNTKKYLEMLKTF